MSTDDAVTFMVAGGKARFSGVLYNRLASVTSYDHTDKDVFTALDRTQFALDYRAPSVLHVYLEARVDWLFSAIGPDAAAAPRGTQKYVFTHIIEPREAYAELANDKIDFRVGNQVFTWGHNELISPVDVLNPLDLRDILSPDLYKLPVIAASTTVALGPRASVSLVVEPFFVPSQIPLLGQNFSVIAPGSTLERNLGKALGSIDRTLDSRLSQLQATKLPDDNPLNSTVGARLQYRLGHFDLAATGIYGWNRLPVVRLDPDLQQVLTNPAPAADATARVGQKVAANQQLVSSEYTRRAVFALDGATTIKAFTFKLDIAAAPHTTVYATTATPLALTELSGVAGADYAHGETLQLSLSFYANGYLQVPAGSVLSFVEPSKDTGARRRDVWQWGVVASARALLWHQRIELRARGIFDGSVLGGTVLATATYHLNHLHHLVLGGLFLGGRSGTLFDYFQRNNEVFYEYRFSF